MYLIDTRMACNILEVSEKTLSTYIVKGWLSVTGKRKGRKLDFHEVMDLRGLKKLHPERYHKQASPIKEKQYIDFSEPSKKDGEI